MPDNKLELPRGSVGNSPSSQELANFKSQLQAWTAARPAQPRDHLVSQRKCEKPRRVANMYQLLCLDHGLQSGLGLNLDQFRPRRRAVPLAPNETRVFLPESEVVPGGCPDRRRSCIVDQTTGDGALELPRWPGGDGDDARIDRDLLVVIDQGSVGFQGTFFLFQHLGLSGYAFFDPWHRAWNDLSASLRSSGFWPIILELIVVLNHRSGPFSGSAFYQVIRETMLELTRA